MKTLLQQLRAHYPDITFIKGDSFYWSPVNKSVTYARISTQANVESWSLLHEVSHGALGHIDYKSDFQLIQLETQAWSHARKLGRQYGVSIDPEYIQDCLDTYRDWLHGRSTCPTCKTVSVQQGPKTYKCFNCKTSWSVSSSRFCRPYRLKQK